MSRIGKLPISIPKGVEIKVSDTNLITVKGPKGILEQQVDADIKVKIDDGVVRFERPTEQKRHKALHGLYRSLVSNMVQGVTEGYTIVQELVGVGFKANATGQMLELSLGYSHNIVFQMPKEIKVETLTERGKNPSITLTSADKQLVGQVAAKIRSLRKPEPYKGKGVIFRGEVIKRKAGKAAAS
ncbi:MAG: 50S ribosomal protein L6 [Bacteroidetes bacterium 4484_276]|nr:MAG: 50S ribosomal protein L6 [Bacteroidetes bacterium 4484_276]OYT14387.1 MAG: 50S ribosomal protein L6 [Bacteroidetes bacterium 4572_114]